MASSIKQRPSSKAPPRAPRKDVLAPLKLAQIEVLKPVLPAEIMASILDYLPPLDLISVAKTSKRMHEMVYDDTRWVRLLRQIGCWNEVEARSSAEGSEKDADRPPSRRPQSRPSTAKEEIHKSNGHITDSSGFDVVEFNAEVEAEITGPLAALRDARSIRGRAREEYGKIHESLNPFYQDIVKTEGSTDSLVFKSYDKPEQQALLLSQLQHFSNADIGLGSGIRRQKLADIVSVFEKAALREFKQGYENGDVDNLMQRYAHVLTTLNGGGAAVELLIHQNHIITRKSDFGSPMDGFDADSGTVSLDHTHAFLTRLSVAFNEEASCINRCFANGPNVSSLFLERMCKDILSPYFIPLLDLLQSTNKAAYIQTLPGTFAQSLNFIRELNPIQVSKDQFEELARQAIERTFEPHVDLYLAEELDQFRSHSDSIVGDWDRQLSEQAATTESLYMSNIHNRQADKRDFLSSFTKVIMAPVNMIPSFYKAPEAKKDGTEKLSAKSTQPSNRSSTLLSPPTPVTPTELPTTEFAAKAAIMNSKFEGIRSLFSIEVALNLVHAAKSSLERTAQFVGLKGELGKSAQAQCEAIFVSLLDSLGHRHVIAGFDRAVNHLSEYRPRQQAEQEKSGVEPLVTFLELVNVGDLILQMVDVFYEQELIAAGLTDRSDFLDPAVKEKRKFEQKLDERVAAGLNKGIGVLMDEVEYLLATKQSVGDFHPELVDPAQRTSDIGPSDAAKAVVQVISSHTRMLVGGTDKSTLDVFNQEIGLRLFTALCKHIKRHRISIEGSIKLISDMNHYFGLIQSMRNAELPLYFKALRELSQVYLIDTADSKEMASIISDASRFHGIFRAEEAYEFAERRADWYQVKNSVEKAMYGVGCTVM
ncbi:F-box domain-containing protein [Arthroderma uncinatum]|uniref:F-box domain-containing protein n=1 Tax=Arthroderma uncinatum TaxID=74035 RepID=UPI00144AC244|nr:F-box domain-containing protein [Arthroderma uncinatum]KAF3483757.1 F-box domain-containing protein [Arthroderma uncinatum]